jgi:hypothetical protein
MRQFFQGSVFDGRRFSVDIQLRVVEGDSQQICSQLGLILCIIFLLSLLDLEQWWLRDEHMLALYEFGHLPVEEGQQQRAYV